MHAPHNADFDSIHSQEREAAGLRPERREAVLSSHAPYHTEVRSCCGAEPDRSIHKSEDYLCEEGVRPGRTTSRAVGGWSLASDAEEELFTAPAFPCDEGAQIIWIADNGSAYHLCSYDTLSGNVFDGMRPCPAVRLATANGIIEPEGQLEVYLTGLEVNARFLALKDYPPVLIIGRLVEQHGFQFHWKAGKAWFVAPDGRRQECRVKNFVPHFHASTSSRTTSAVASASPAPLQSLVVPGLAIANEAHPIARDEDAGQQGQPPDAAEDVQAEECEEEDRR